MGCSAGGSAGTERREHQQKIGSPVKVAKAADTQGAPALDGDSDVSSDDEETFEEMKALVVTACDGAIKSAEWRLKGAWTELDKSLRSSSVSGMAPVLEAARSRDAKLLAAEIGRAGTAATAAQHVLTSGRVLQLRRGIFAAALGSDAAALARLLDAAESLGEQCDLERDFVIELCERAGEVAPDSTATLAGQPLPRPSIAPPAGGRGPPPQPAATPSFAKGKTKPSFEVPTDKTAQTAKPSSPMSPQQEALATLGLSPGANVLPSAEAIRAAYRRAALQWHPDRPHNAGISDAAEKFRLAREAYERLRDHSETMK